MILKELIFNNFYYGRVVVILERTDLEQISTMGGCGGLERTDFNSFYFGRVWWYLKELI